MRSTNRYDRSGVDEAESPVGTLKADERQRVNDSRIKDERQARYRMAQVFPVLLVIGNTEGEVRWIEVGDWLKRSSEDGRKPVKQIVFAGERFDAVSVQNWRKRVLGGG